MSKYYIVAFASISTVFTLICMDKTKSTFQLDLASSKPPVFAQTNIIDFSNRAEAFTTLTEDRALILKSLIAQEQAGDFCQELSMAEEVLREVIVVHPGQEKHYFRNGFLDDKLIQDTETTTFLFRIAEKSMKRSCLIESCHEDNSLNFGEALENGYVANSYGSFEPYEGRIITPLHHVLCLEAEGFIDYQSALYYTTNLLQKKANPNARDDFGNMPMHHVSTPGLLMLLLEHGAKYDEYGYENRTPLHNHIRTKNWPVVRCLLKLPEVDVNAYDDNEDTPLHEAVRQDAPVDIMKSLLALGACYDQVNCQDESALGMAQHKPDIMNVFDFHLKYRLCNAIAEDKKQDVLDILDQYLFDWTDILYWAKKFYPKSEGTKILGQRSQLCCCCFKKYYPEKK